MLYVAVKNQNLLNKQEASRIIGNLGLKTPLNKIPLLGNIYFKKWMSDCKMNEIVNKFLFAQDEFMPEMHLKQPGFTYSVCGLFTKNKEWTQKFKETGDSRYIYKNGLNKACFQHDMFSFMEVLRFSKKNSDRFQK